MGKDDFMTTEERQARTSSESALLAQRNDATPPPLEIVEALEREHAKLDQKVYHFSAGDRVRASGFLFELLQDVDAFLIEE
jgi:hypothetical protein